MNPRLTFSGGVRWEAQNHVSDHNDWAPRVSMAYALDGGGKQEDEDCASRGIRTFYDRFDFSNLIT